MSARAASSPSAAPSTGSRKGWLPYREFRPDGGGLAFAVISLGVAALAAYELVHGSERTAVGLSLIPISLWLLTRPTVPLVLLGATIPILTSVTGGSDAGGGYEVAVSDILIVLVSVGIAMEWTVSARIPAVAALRPVARPLLQYSAFMLLLLSIHPGVRDALKTGQRFELFLLPMFVGAFAALTDWHLRLLKAYVIAVTVLAAVWPLDHLQMQHNPVGQLIANGAIILIGVRQLRRLFPCLFILVPGLVLTGSRGAILAGLLGVVVMIALQRSGTRPVMRRILPLTLLALGAFALAPSSLRDRVTTLSAGQQSAAAYAISIRQQYSHDAHQIIDAHPWVGIGVGNYFAGTAAAGTSTRDPHDVLLLQEAEGGYLFAASFVVLIVGVLFALRRMRQVEIAPVAAGVLVATLAHGLVDVYWVRGTPILSWLMVGMACGMLTRLRAETGAPQHS